MISGYQCTRIVIFAGADHIQYIHKRKKEWRAQ